MLSYSCSILCNLRYLKVYVWPILTFTIKTAYSTKRQRLQSSLLSNKWFSYDIWVDLFSAILFALSIILSHGKWSKLNYILLYCNIISLYCKIIPNNCCEIMGIFHYHTWLTRLYCLLDIFHAYTHTYEKISTKIQ